MTSCKLWSPLRHIFIFMTDFKLNLNRKISDHMARSHWPEYGKSNVPIFIQCICIHDFLFICMKVLFISMFFFIYMCKLSIYIDEFLFICIIFPFICITFWFILITCYLYASVFHLIIYASLFDLYWYNFIYMHQFFIYMHINKIVSI